jgi:hypothetical protein
VLSEVALLGKLHCLSALVALELVDVCNLLSAFFQVGTHAVWTADANTDDCPQTLATLAGLSTAQASPAQVLQGLHYATTCEGGALDA